MSSQPTTSLIPSGAPIIIPRVAQPVQEHVPDYEVELVIVIGKEAKNVSVDKALDYVLGYTGANDVL
jgi:2-keto-4-pentenoate hydratase/2-oxohepta-3-ene-1,7-dioic acid hydratase in catechol pathway